MKPYYFVEIDMRNDFADDPRSNLPVPGTYAIVGKMRALEEAATRIIEVFDHHDVDDVVSLDEFECYPPHCVPGSWGHQRIGGLFVPPPGEEGRLVRIPKNNVEVWPGMANYKGDDSDNALNLALQGTETIVVGGVVTQICIDRFVQGAVARGLTKKIIVVRDCIAGLETDDLPPEDLVIESWKEAGVQIMNFGEFLGWANFPYPLGL